MNVRTNRNTDRQKYRQTDRQTYRQTDEIYRHHVYVGLTQARPKNPQLIIKCTYIYYNIRKWLRNRFWLFKAFYVYKI